jgi:flagellar basal body rod protein FlgC
MTVQELLSRVSSRELAEWIAFFELEPWGTEVEDWRAGLIASTIANANRDQKRRRRPYEPQDFIPRRDVPTKQIEEQSVEDQIAIVEMWARILSAANQEGGR